MSRVECNIPNDSEPSFYIKEMSVFFHLPFATEYSFAFFNCQYALHCVFHWTIHEES